MDFDEIGQRGENSLMKDSFFLLFFVLHTYSFFWNTNITDGKNFEDL